MQTLHKVASGLLFFTREYLNTKLILADLTTGGRMQPLAGFASGLLIFLGREAMHHPIPLPIASRDAWFTGRVAWSSLMCRPKAIHAANIRNK
jgi:hypothetical protein